METNEVAKPFKIWNDVSRGYWNSIEFIKDRITQQHIWLSQLEWWEESGQITVARHKESSEGAQQILERLEKRLTELTSRPCRCENYQDQCFCDLYAVGRCDGTNIKTVV